MTAQTAKIAIRSSCAGTVHIASLKVGRKVVYETRAWGTAHNAAEDAKSRATQLGLAINPESDRVKALRAALAEKFGAGKYKITGHIGVNEQVHAYGRMPNSVETGWYLYGNDMLEAEMRLGLQ